MANKKLKFKIVALIAVLTIGFIGATWAYLEQELQVHNEFKTVKFSTKIEEVFVSPTDWLPGKETNKDVWVTNEGDISVCVKATLNQQWIRLLDVNDNNGNILGQGAGEALPLTFKKNDGKDYVAKISFGKDVVLLSSGQTSHISLELPVVSSIEEAQGKWLLVSDAPDIEGNFVFYYIGALEAEKQTPFLIDAVTMNPFINLSIIGKKTLYDESTGQWITQILKNPEPGYENAEYTLDINVTTIQATSDAIFEVFNTNIDNQEIVAYLAQNYAID